jgi:hypothetical protein
MPFTPAAKDRPGYNQGAGTSLPRSGLLEQTDAPEYASRAVLKLRIFRAYPVTRDVCRR